MILTEMAEWFRQDWQDDFDKPLSTIQSLATIAITAWTAQWECWLTRARFYLVIPLALKDNALVLPSIISFDRHWMGLRTTAAFR